MTAKDWIERLQMKAHAEGGYYQEVYRAPDTVTAPNGKKRAVVTSIYYLFENSDQSHFHRLDSDEIWYYHDGDQADIHLLHPSGEYEIKPIGREADLHVIVSRDTIFGARLSEGSSFILVGCVVAPGFEFEGVRLHALGGKYDPVSKVFKGSETIRQMANFYPELCIVGACSVHHLQGVTTQNENENAVKQKMIEVSQKTLVLATNDKIETALHYRVCDFGAIDYLALEETLEAEVKSLYTHKHPQLL